MKVTITYRGDPAAPGTAKPSVTMRGIEFPLNVGVGLDVASDAGKTLVAKLRANREFVVDEPGHSGEAKTKAGKGNG